MGEYLLELFLSRFDEAAVELRVAQARAAAEELTAGGIPVRVVRSIYLPDEETCFLLYDARSVADVREAARRAGLSEDHITEALGASASGDHRPAATKSATKPVIPE